MRSVKTIFLAQEKNTWTISKVHFCNINFNEFNYRFNEGTPRERRVKQIESWLQEQQADKIKAERLKEKK